MLKFVFVFLSFCSLSQAMEIDSSLELKRYGRFSFKKDFSEENGIRPPSSTESDERSLYKCVLKELKYEVTEDHLPPPISKGVLLTCNGEKALILFDERFLISSKIEENFKAAGISLRPFDNSSVSLKMDPENQLSLIFNNKGDVSLWQVNVNRFTLKTFGDIDIPQDSVFSGNNCFLTGHAFFNNGIMRASGNLHVRSESSINLLSRIEVSGDTTLESPQVNMRAPTRFGGGLTVETEKFDYVPEALKANEKISLILKQGHTFNKPIETLGELEIYVPRGASNPIVIRETLISYRHFKIKAPTQTIYLGDQNTPVNQTHIASVDGRLDLEASSLQLQYGKMFGDAGIKLESSQGGIDIGSFILRERISLYHEYQGRNTSSLFTPQGTNGVFIQSNGDLEIYSSQYAYNHYGTLYVRGNLHIKGLKNAFMEEFKNLAGNVGIYGDVFIKATTFQNTRDAKIKVTYPYRRLPYAFLEDEASLSDAASFDVQGSFHLESNAAKNIDSRLRIRQEFFINGQQYTLAQQVPGFINESRPYIHRSRDGYGGGNWGSANKYPYPPSLLLVGQIFEVDHIEDVMMSSWINTMKNNVLKILKAQLLTAKEKLLAANEEKSFFRFMWHKATREHSGRDADDDATEVPSESDARTYFGENESFPSHWGED